MWKILLATDGSEAASAARALVEALLLPEGTSITVLAVLPDPAPLSDPLAGGFVAASEMMTELQVSQQNLAQEAAATASQHLARSGVTVTTELRHGDPAREILAVGDDIEADLIVVGSKGLTGLDSLLLGSVARNVAKHARRPVLVGRVPRNGLREVVVATDGSNHAQHAAAFAGRLPLPQDAAVTVVSVVRPYAPFPCLFPTDEAQFNAAIAEVQNRRLEDARRVVVQAEQQLGASGRQVRSEVREGDPTSQILALVEERHADLLVAGARGVSLIEGLLVGSVADRLLKEAHCSVLIVP